MQRHRFVDLLEESTEEVEVPVGLEDETSDGPQHTQIGDVVEVDEATQGRDHVLSRRVLATRDGPVRRSKKDGATLRPTPPSPGAPPTRSWGRI